MMSFRSIAAVMSLGFLLVSAAPAAADEVIPTKEMWQKRKTTYKIPDGVSKKVKMGDEFAKYVKDTEAARKQNMDFAKRIPIYDRLEDKLGAYKSDLEKAVAKNKKIDGAAVKYIDDVLQKVVSTKNEVLAIVNVGDNLKNLISTAKSAYAGFDGATGKDVLQSFWSQEMRAIGTAMPVLVQKDKDFAPEHKAFKTAINDVNNSFTKDPFSAEQTVLLIKKSIVDLESKLDEKGAW